jgi:hypothetical protein
MCVWTSSRYTMSAKTKERLTQATALAAEVLGESGVNQNSGILNAIVLSMALDDLSGSINAENEKLIDCIFRSAGHISE